MKWERHGDMLRGLDKHGCVRAILWLENNSSTYYGVAVLGEPREYASRNKRQLMRLLAAEVEEAGYR